MGVEQHLGTFLSNLVQDTQENKETLLTVNTSINNQLTKLDNMITALGEVQKTTESNLGYFMKLSDNVMFDFGNVTGIDETVRIKKFRCNLKGTLTIKGDFSLPEQPSAGLYYFRIKLNGTTVKEVTLNGSDSGPVNVNEIMQIEIGDEIDIYISSSYDNSSMLFANARICYELVAKDYTNKDVALIDI